MRKLTAIIVLTFGLCLTASADVWKWVDAFGDTHFVDTMTTIYTWLDEFGKVHYSDKPEHANAVSVELVWHSTGALNGEDASDDAGVTRPKRKIDPNETEIDRIERERAEAYYCKRASKIYDSYVNAPKLYKTSADGKKVYLTGEEVEVMLSETEAKVAKLCNY